MKADRRIGGWAVSVLVPATVLLSGYPAIRLSAQAFPTKPPKPTPLSPARFPPFQRSEEHTSELQSLAYLVCRLLLEKKNTQPREPPVLSTLEITRLPP